MAVFKNRLAVFESIMNRAQTELTSLEMKEWVNLHTTKDKFTALHYASFRGNIKMCQALLDNQANKNARNKYGLNVVHIAAQGD